MCRSVEGWVGLVWCGRVGGSGGLWMVWWVVDGLVGCGWVCGVWICLMGCGWVNFLNGGWVGWWVVWCVDCLVGKVLLLMND